MLFFPFILSSLDLHEPARYRPPLFLCSRQFQGYTLALPRDSDGCLHCMSTQTCSPLSPAPHPFFSLPSLLRVPHRKHSVSHGEQRSFFSTRANCHTRMCTHTSSYEQTFTARLSMSTETLTNARLHVRNAQNTAFTRAALVTQLNQDASIL